MSKSLKKTITRVTSALVAITTATFVCLFVCAQTLPQQEGDPRIVANGEAEVGELIRLEIQATADDYEWLVVPASPDFEIFAEGRKAVFSARKPGEYLFIAAYTLNNKIELMRHKLQVKGPPKPIVPPGPNASILELIPYWCHAMNIKPEEKEALAANFSSIATAASAGEYETVQDFVVATAELNKGIGCKNLLDKISSFVIKQAEGGKLETMEQHILLWNRIAAALK